MDVMKKSEIYYDQLEELMLLCKELSEEGKPYMAVMLCHELYRFLYPVEPYCNFKNESPVAYCVELIGNLNKLARDWKSSITGYPLTGGPLSQQKETVLAKKTSDLYVELWKSFEDETIAEESLKLLTLRIPKEIISAYIKGKKVMDLGCGSGRYSIALSMAGAEKVVGVDFNKKAFENAQKILSQKKLNVEFVEADILNLPFEDQSFDFVFSNGVLHHTASLEKGLDQLVRVLRGGGKSFIYLYAAGGIFWRTRDAMRKMFKHIPFEYAQRVLEMIGLPANRFVFLDAWYVPVERYSTKEEVEKMFSDRKVRFRKLISTNEFDLDKAIDDGIEGAREMWGDGEHRYFLEK